MLKFVILI